MTRILQINSSIFSDDGQSSALADAYVERLRQAEPGLSLHRRDLARHPVPHLTAETFAAALTEHGERSAAQAEAAAGADALIAELEWADLLVLGVPMYNLGVPSPLKAWFDHVARAGRTFRYTATGPVGLLPGKRARVFTARGGVYDTASDLVTPHVRQFLGLLGIEDVEFVFAEGLAMGDEHRSTGLHRAEAGLAALPEVA